MDPPSILSEGSLRRILRIPVEINTDKGEDSTSYLVCEVLKDRKHTTYHS